MNRKKPWSASADIKIITGALRDQRRLSPKTIKRIEAGLKKFCGIKTEGNDVKTTMATLAEIKAWAKKVARRNLARESYTLRPSYIVEKVRKEALWTDGEHFKLPFFWKASIGFKVTS